MPLPRRDPARISDDAYAFPGGDKVKLVMARLDQLARTIDPEAPWAHPDAERLDATTFES